MARLNIRAVLEQYGETAKQAAIQALRENAETVAEEAKRRCPVRTGRLRDSIHVKPKNENTMRVVANAKNENGYYYGWLIEHRQPFLNSALEDKREELKQNVKDKIRAALGR